MLSTFSSPEFPLTLPCQSITDSFFHILDTNLHLLLLLHITHPVPHLIQPTSVLDVPHHVLPDWIFLFNNNLNTTFPFSTTWYLLFNWSITFLTSTVPFFISSTLAKSCCHSTKLSSILLYYLGFFFLNLLPFFFPISPKLSVTTYDPVYKSLFISGLLSFTRLSISPSTTFTSLFTFLLSWAFKPGTSTLSSLPKTALIFWSTSFSSLLATLWQYLLLQQPLGHIKDWVLWGSYIKVVSITSPYFD